MWLTGTKKSGIVILARRERMARLIEEHPSYVRRLEFLYGALIFLFDWICCYGLREHIIFDRGPHFDNSIMTSFLACYGLKLFTGTPYHPQKTGQVERTVQTVRSVIL